jgi:general L-amino acid transport system ATP-binding protein
MTEMNNDDIIICRDVHKWFGDFQALCGITTTVARGEVVVICGPSGSGKSTFIRTINRLEEHQRGDIIVDVTSATSPPSGRRSGWCSSSSTFFPT